MEQLNVFDFFNGGRKPFEVNNKIRLIELFARQVSARKQWH